MFLITIFCSTLKKEYKLLIGERTAEAIKMTIGTVFKGGRSDSMDIRGRDMVTGLPRTITIHSEEIERALHESVAMIVQSAKKCIRKKHHPSYRRTLLTVVL